MDQFVVSARKYRPTTFDTVVGQSHITTTLKNAIKNNHLAQAFLFCGPRGVGKTTCARILAKTINCLNLSAETEACDQCDSCVSFKNNASFNIHELDAASNNSVDDIRNLVDQVRYPPQSGRYKIYIIDEVHMLSNSAFNAFLKTLEEPPSYAIFILATTEKHKIIPTILSRCQIFDFNRIQQSDISKHLHQIAQKEKIDADEEALQLIAQKADGGLRDALSMFDLIVTFSSDNCISYQTTIDNLHILDYDYYFRMTDYLLTQNLPKALLTLDEILRNGFDGHNFAVGLCEHFRNIMVCKDAETVKLLEVSPSIQKKYLAQASKSSLSFLLSAINIGSQCDLNYKSSKNQRLHVELALMKMAHLTSVIHLSSTPLGRYVGPDTPPHQGNGTVEEADADKKKVDTSVNDTKEFPTPTAPVIHHNGKEPESQSITTQTTSSPTSIAQEPILPNGYKSGMNTKLKSTIKLGDIQNSPVALAETSIPTAYVAVEEKKFTLRELQSHWDEFAKMKEEQGKHNDFIILSRELELREDYLIHLKLDNNIQLQQLNALRGEVLGFLRQQLQNHSIQLQAEVVVTESKKIIYTSQDKFRYLAEKNATLLELRNIFGLDVDY
jgi:DNA polymerase-3 subunit gamma/tau